ncbi:MAG: pyridoxal-phosphate dependent enzyme [Bacteroidota bacterium]
MGNTPLVKIERLFANQRMNLYAKLEQFNLSGSIKDRPALLMIEEALHEGKIEQGTTIIESSSGNMGISIAHACLRHGLHFIMYRKVFVLKGKWNV